MFFSFLQSLLILKKTPLHKNIHKIYVHRHGFNFFIHIVARVRHRDESSTLKVYVSLSRKYR